MAPWGWFYEKLKRVGSSNNFSGFILNINVLTLILCDSQVHVFGEIKVNCAALYMYSSTFGHVQLLS